MVKYRRCDLWVVLVLTGLLIGGCVPRLIPKASQVGQIDMESNIITKEKEGIRVSVQTQEWSYEPYTLEDYFTPFLFLIKNGTDQKVPLKLADWVLFDEHGNQFNAIPPEGVDLVMTSRDLYGRGVYPSVYFRYEETRAPYSVGFELPAYLRRPFSNITLLGLTEGEIYPKSQVRGFVYFKKATTYGQNLRVKVHINGFEEEFEFELKK